MAAQPVHVVDPEGGDDYPAGAALREAAFVRYQGVRSSLESSNGKMVAVLALGGGLLYVLFQAASGVPHRDGIQYLWTWAVVVSIAAVAATLYGLIPVKLDGISNPDFYGAENAAEPAGLVELTIAQRYIAAADDALPRAMAGTRRRFTLAAVATVIAAISTAVVFVVQVWT